jgi:hypothetical protein
VGSAYLSWLKAVGWDTCWGEEIISRWLSGTLITLVTLWAACCCHTAILFSQLCLDNLIKKRPFKGQNKTTPKSGLQSQKMEVLIHIISC